MVNADSILMPHPPEVIAAIVQRNLAEIERLFPGMIQKVRKWMRSKEFKNNWLLIPSGYRLSSRAILARLAPFDMKQKIRNITIDDYNFKYRAALEDSDGKYEKMMWLADHMWKECKFYNRYIVIARPLPPIQYKPQ